MVKDKHAPLKEHQTNKQTLYKKSSITKEIYIPIKRKPIIYKTLQLFFLNALTFILERHLFTQIIDYSSQARKIVATNLLRGGPTCVFANFFYKCKIVFCKIFFYNYT